MLLDLRKSNRPWSSRDFRWRSYVGNKDLVKHGQDMTKAVRFRGKCSGWNTMITGPSRSGKTSFVRLLMQTIGCLQVTLDMVEPCGECSNCHFLHHIHGNRDWENYAALVPAPNDYREFASDWLYGFRSYNCATMSESDIRDLIFWASQHDVMQRFIFLDEIHRLNRNFLDEKLLVVMDHSSAIWIGASAKISKEERDENSELEKMFLNRFDHKFVTGPVADEEIIFWMVDQCQQAGIRCEDPESTLSLLAQRSRRLPGFVTQILNKAYNSEDMVITREMVEKHIFDFDDV